MDDVNVNAGARVYSDGRFRSLAEEEGAYVPIRILPTDGVFDAHTPNEPRLEFCDVFIISSTDTLLMFTLSSSNGLAVVVDDDDFTGWFGDTTGAIYSGDTIKLAMTADRTIGATFEATPSIDSIRPNPQWRSDSASIYGARFLAAGVLRNITIAPPENATQKYWSNTRVDYYIPANWPRGWNRLVLTNSDSLRDTLSQYIAIIKKGF